MMEIILSLSSVIWDILKGIWDFFRGKAGKNSQSNAEVPHDLTYGAPRTTCLYRGKTIWKIRWILQKNKHLVLVNGFGGVGKTTIAQKLYRQIHRKYVHAGWISYNTSLADSINSAYRNEKIKEKEQRISDFLNSLQEGKSLLVIDNIEDKEEDTDLLKKLRGMENLTLILTSRMAGMEDFTPVSVDFFGEDDAIRLFRHYYGKACKTNAVREIVNLVQCHTLSVEILAKTAKRDRRDLGDFYKDLVKKGIACPDLTVKSHYEKGSHTMAEYLKKLFALEKKEPEEIRILQNLALMPTMELPPDELVEWIQTNKNTMENLVDSGWLDYHEETPDHPAGYYMHPLVKETIRLDREAFPESIGTEFVDCVGECRYFEEDKTYITTLPKLEIASVVFDNINNIKKWETVGYAHACHNLGNTYDDFGLYEQAENILQTALSIEIIKMGDKHPDVASTRNSLAVVYRNMGNYEKAISYHQKSISISKEIFGENHPSTVFYSTSLAALYLIIGRDEDAEILYLNSARYYENHPEESCLVRASIYNDLSVIYLKKEKYEDAEEFCKKSLLIRESVGDDIGTSGDYHNLANIYYEQGKYNEAEKYYLKAIEIRENALGKDHPDTITTCNNLAGLYNAQRKYEKAEKYYLRNLNARKKMLGESHQDVAVTYLNIGILKYNTQKYDEAMEYFLQSVSILYKKLYSNRQYTDAAFNAISITYPKSNYNKGKSFEIWFSEIKNNFCLDE